MTRTLPVALLALLTLTATPALAQDQDQDQGREGWARHIVVPQHRCFATDGVAAVRLESVRANIDIIEQVATTTLELMLVNASAERQEAELLLPVPSGAAVRGFSLEGGARASASVLSKARARLLYESIVAKIEDPALLEFAGYTLVRSSVFAIEAGARQQLTLRYEHLLAVDGARIDYVLPRSESTAVQVPWQISARVKAREPIATVYSPSHPLAVRRIDERTRLLRVPGGSALAPGPFRLSMLHSGKGLSASLFAYPDARIKGGYFLLFAGLPRGAMANEDALKREVTLVLDRSGSMHGEKLEQVREAALQLLVGLDDGEAFNIIIYNEGVDQLAPTPLLKTPASMAQARAFIKEIKPRGGTNIHDALVAALAPKPRQDMLPIVLFLTDGLPTIGKTSERAIRDAAVKNNTYKRRIFTFGVGVKVNTPLLEAIAAETRARATFVLPREDVEVKVARVFKSLAGPLLASPELTAIEADGKPAFGRLRAVLPRRLPDLFEGDQLVVLGQYKGSEPVTIRIRGTRHGKERSFRFQMSLDKASQDHGFVARLWASRQIGMLNDAIRRLGADGGPVLAAAKDQDPRIKELVDEIVRLSLEFGVLTEYTAFLANEGTDLSKRKDVLARCNGNFVRRAMRTRSGRGSVNQELNGIGLKGQSWLNPNNVYCDENLNRATIGGVQQINDLAFFYRAGRWVDSRLVSQAAQKPEKIIDFGSKEFLELVAELANEGRQGSVALTGEILLDVKGERVLIRGPKNK